MCRTSSAVAPQRKPSTGMPRAIASLDAISPVSRVVASHTAARPITSWNWS